MSAAFRKPKRGVHSFEFIRNDPAPRYSDSNLDTLDGLRDEDQEQREKNAQLRLLQRGHHTPVLPTPAPEPKQMAGAGMLAIGVLLGLCMGFIVAVMVGLTGVVL